MHLLFFISFVLTGSKVAKGGKEMLKGDQPEEKSNPIRSLSFEKKNDVNFALVVLARKTDKNNVNLMRSANPDDPNSYIIARDLSGDIKHIPGNKWKVALNDVEPTDSKTVYSIQIREGNNIFQTEAFYFDKKLNKFKLLREKGNETFFTTENIIYICLAALAAIVALVISYVLCCKK